MLANLSEGGLRERIQSSIGKSFSSCGAVVLIQAALYFLRISTVIHRCGSIETFLQEAYIF